MIKFEYDGHAHDGFACDKVIFEFDTDGMGVEEVFFRWVRFMNAAGYELDPAEMQKMWKGERYETED